MSNQERDTRFLGFANLEIDKLEQKRLIPIHPKSLRNDMAILLAQCAYDLVLHALKTVNDNDNLTMGMYYIEDIPDFTEFPPNE